MAIPTLPPTATTSAIVLPSTGSTTAVAAALPIGTYSSSAQFISGAVAQVAYTYKKLGGDVLDIELTPANVYANNEQASLEYSYLVNLHQAKNSLGDLLGNATSSFDEDGEIATGSHEPAALKFPMINEILANIDFKIMSPKTGKRKTCLCHLKRIAAFVLVIYLNEK